MQLSVILATHNPDPGRLRRTLEALRGQSLPAADWETIIVNNASGRFPPAGFFTEHAPSNHAVVVEPVLGLSAARRHGFARARADVAILVDDDNLLAPDYLANVAGLFAAHPAVGAAGGPSLPDFERPPVGWEEEFLPLLALRELGPLPLISQGLRPAGAARNTYPAFAPIGAGMAIRRAAWTAWGEAGARGGTALTDRRGADLSSAGDNDIVLCAMRAGWEVAYFPSLRLTHLIPRGRLDPAYLARLNRGIQRSWMQVLARHEANPWPALTPFGATVRKAKAWFTHAAWGSPAARIRWAGACGHFEGRVKA